MPEQPTVDRSMAARLSGLEARQAEALSPGSRSGRGSKAKGKMTARERIDYLLDEDSFQELDLLVRHRAHGIGLERLTGPTPTGSSPASGRSTAGASASSARTSRSSGDHSARRTPRRSTRSWTWRFRSACRSSGSTTAGGARIQEGVVVASRLRRHLLPQRRARPASSHRSASSSGRAPAARCTRRR